MSVCVFCDIIAGRSPASVVAEDPETITVADPRQPGWPRGGHLLVVPKRHVEFVYDLPDELAAAVMQRVVRVAGAVRRAVAPDGISVWSSNGAGAGQEVPHVHLHVLARFEADGLLQVYSERPQRPDRSELDDLAARVRQEIESTRLDTGAR